MKHLPRLLLLLLCLAAGHRPSSASPSVPPAEIDTTALCRWTAAVDVSPEAVSAFGLDRCFAAERISDAVFARMSGKSYRPGCPVPRSDLRYLRVLHYTLDGTIRTGEMVCHQAVAEDLIRIFRALYDARYPIERMVLIDNYGAQDEPSMLANNSSAFNFRFIGGTRQLSNHSMGCAVDINPLYNPYVKVRRDGSLRVSPKAARPYADRKGKFPYKITADDLCCRLFKQYGFTWGGDWRSLKDYQHFERRIR